MYIYIYIYIHTHVYIYTDCLTPMAKRRGPHDATLHMQRHRVSAPTTSTHVCIYALTRISSIVHVWLCACMQACVYVCMCVCMYALTRNSCVGASSGPALFPNHRAVVQVPELCVCMYVCMYVCVLVRMSCIYVFCSYVVYVCAFVHMYTLSQSQGCCAGSITVCMYVCVFVRMYVGYVCVFVRMYVHVYIFHVYNIIGSFV